MFRKKQKAVRGTPCPVATMGLPQLLACLSATPKPAFGTMIARYRRLIEIGLFAHGYSDADRGVALRAADMCEADIIAACQGVPGIAAGFKAAAAQMIDQARCSGYGRILWCAEELQVRLEHIILFAVQPKFSRQLPDYLSMLSAETRRTTRCAIVNAMITARREHADQTDVQVLFELVAMGDPAIPMLMEFSEITIIRKAPDDYAAAEWISGLFR